MISVIFSTSIFKNTSANIQADSLFYIKLQNSACIFTYRGTPQSMFYREFSGMSGTDTKNNKRKLEVLSMKDTNKY